MPELAPQLISAFILGLLGGGHCLGMCGGLMGALTLAIPPEQRGRRLQLLLGYNLGRVLSYAAAGLLLGLGGWALANSPAATALRVVAALLLVAMGLYLASWWSGLTRIEALGKGLWRFIQPLTRRFMPVHGLPQALALGALWGWLPCGLVYSTLLWAASQGDASAPIFSDSPDSRIAPTGNLRLGDGSTEGFLFTGVLEIAANQVVTLRDADLAELGRSTSIARRGVLVAGGDVEVGSGDVLRGSGVVDGNVVVLSGGSVSPANTASLRRTLPPCATTRRSPTMRSA